jgi:hypothetical protein
MGAVVVMGIDVLEMVGIALLEEGTEATRIVLVATLCTVGRIDEAALLSVVVPTASRTVVSMDVAIADVEVSLVSIAEMAVNDVIAVVRIVAVVIIVMGILVVSRLIIPVVTAV